MAVTIRDVAKKAKVSIGTVSRFLNGAKVRESNRKRIESAIADLKFEENFFARRLIKSKTMAILVLVPTIDDLFSGSIVRVMEKEYEKENYSIILSNYHGNPQLLKEKLNFFRTRVDGVVLFPFLSKEGEGEIIKVLKKYLESNIPVQIFNENIEALKVDKFFTDNEDASFRATELLIHNGHKKIAIINGFDNDYVGKNRLNGFVKALQLYNINIDTRYIKNGSFTMNGGYVAAMELFDEIDPPTALLITNYNMSYGAMIAVQQKKIKVPEELSVISFDYSIFADIIQPPLSVIEQATEKMARKACHIMIERLKGCYNEEPKIHFFPAKILIRDSVKMYKE